MKQRGGLQQVERAAAGAHKQRSHSAAWSRFSCTILACQVPSLCLPGGG